MQIENIDHFWEAIEQLQEPRSNSLIDVSIDPEEGDIGHWGAFILQTGRVNAVVLALNAVYDKISQHITDLSITNPTARHGEPRSTPTNLSLLICDGHGLTKSFARPLVKRQFSGNPNIINLETRQENLSKLLLGKRPIRNVMYLTDLPYILIEKS